jgi:hypothetical protein
VEILRELVATSYESLKADKATQVEQKDDMELIQRALKQALSKADNELKADGEACGEVHVTLLLTMRSLELVLTLYSNPLRSGIWNNCGGLCTEGRASDHRQRR